MDDALTMDDSNLLGAAMNDDMLGGALGGDLDNFLPNQDETGQFSQDNEAEDDIFADTDMDQKIMDSENMELDPSLIPDSETKTPLQKWQQEHAEMLINRRETARQQKEELITKAKEDIEKFYNERKKKIETVQEQNKQHETAYFQEIKELMEYGAHWEKVGRLVNLTPKPNEKPGTSKVGRMRTLLIQLKNEKRPAHDN